MFANIVTAMRRRVAGWGRAIGEVISKLAKPNSSMAATLLSGSRDVTLRG